MNEYAEKQKAQIQYVSEKTSEFEKFFKYIKKFIKIVVKDNDLKYNGYHCGYLFNDEVYKAAVSISKSNTDDSLSYYMNLFDNMYEIIREQDQSLYVLVDIKINFKTNYGILDIFIIFIFKEK